MTRFTSNAARTAAAPPGAYRGRGHDVPLESPLDREGRVRGNSVHSIDRAVPMLPEALSNGVCSLNPREDRLVMSAIMNFDAAGHPLAAVMVPGVICSSERMTYTTSNSPHRRSGDERVLRHLHHHFRAMRGLALLLKARRDENGSIDFDLPEPIIEFDEQQNMTNIGRSERTSPTASLRSLCSPPIAPWPTIFSRAASTPCIASTKNPKAARSSNLKSSPAPSAILSASKIFISAKSPCATAKFPRPQSGRPETRGYGRERQQRVSLPGADILITPQHYQRLVAKLAGHPEERIVSYQCFALSAGALLR